MFKCTVWRAAAIACFVGRGCKIRFNDDPLASIATSSTTDTYSRAGKAKQAVHRLRGETCSDTTKSAKQEETQLASGPTG